MPELDDTLMAEIQSFTDQGNAFMDEEDFAGAAAWFEKAMALVPEPVTDHYATTWILTAIGDARFCMGEHEAAREALQKAMHCPDALGNPFIHLRLGQCQFELGNTERAADELARAYMGDAEQIFEAEDPKYLAFVKTKLLPPATGPDEAPKKPWWKFW